MQAGPSYTVLRIKRKATEPPLSSLVIQDQDRDSPRPSPSGQPKRQRNVSYRRNMGVFKLADTVPDSWIGRGAEGEVLRERIMGLLGREEVSEESPSRDKGKGKEGGIGDARGAVVDQEEEEDDEEAVLSGTKRPVPAATASTAPPRPYPGSSVPTTARSSTPPHAGPSTSASSVSKIQYRVIPSAAEIVARDLRRGRGLLSNGLPPKVVSSAEFEAQARSPFRFIDAQAVSSAPAEPDDSDASRRHKAASPEVVDPQMAAFEGMLQEYLTLERSEAARKDAEEQYVYDLYYRDIRDSSIIAARSDGAESSSIGALIGFDDLSPPSTPSSSEPEDEADEDSNDEDYYRNDYPEDEDADSDMEGYEDAFGDEGEDDDEDSSGESGESDEDRGKWGYR